MEVWLFGIIILLSGCVTALLVKVYVMQKSAREMEEAFTDRIRSDTNTLIDISSRDRYLCSLAASMNVQLKMLRKERRRYQKGDRQVKDAVTNISHDLRTPLTVICGYLDLLEKEEKSETVGRYLQLIRNRTEVMRQLTEELFCYSIVTSTTHNLSYETVSLNAALEECISAYYAVLKHAEVEAGKLFHRFYTVEDARKSTGLGLSIAKTLTEQMGGRIYARYRDGSVFIHIIFEKAQLPAYE